jgi:hypothetical protein
MRIRQVALVARTLEPVVDDLRAVLGLEHVFHDPGVGVFGLHNAVMPIRDQFLEVVSPLEEGTTAGRFLDKRGGDGGYMVIFQTADLAGDRGRLGRLGIRIVWEITLDDIATVHLHPRDVGGAIVSIDQPDPPPSWRWGGPEWTAAPAAGVRAITSVTIAAAEPDVVAARWAGVLDAPAAGREIRIDGGVIRFVAAEDRTDGVVAVGLDAPDPERVLEAARARGLRPDAHGVSIGGVRFVLAS